MSEQLYIVKWQSSYTGRIGGGKPVNKATAESWVKQGNKKGNFTYWLEKVEGGGVQKESQP